MNSNPTLSKGNPSPINFNDIFLQLVQQGMKNMMRGDASETEMLRGWIEKRNVADLVEHRPTKPREVAQLCLDMVEKYPKEVTVLLWNAEVAGEAGALVRLMAPCDAPDAQSKALALAQALLDAGHGMEMSDTAWPVGVSDLLKERRTAHDDYLIQKTTKFQEGLLKGGLQVFHSASLPFLSKSTNKSVENFSEGVLDEAGKRLERRHLLEASKDDRKLFLEQVNQKRTVSLSLETLENRCVNAKRLRGELAVQCAPESFGQLLAHMASRIPPGKQQAFDLSFSLAGDFGNVCDMVVFVEKTSEKEPMAIKVSLYDPEVTGDMSHMRALPEELAKLSFHDFDLRRAFKPGSVDLLNLMQDDWDLAISLRGRYIPRHSKMLVESFLSALAYGNLYGLQHAITELLTIHGVGVPIDDLNARSKDLGLAVHAAMAGGHVKVMQELEGSPLMLGSLTQNTRNELVAAKRGMSGALSSVRDIVQGYWARRLGVEAGGGARVESTRPGDRGEQVPLTATSLRGQGGVLRQVLDDVADVYVKEFGKPRDAVDIEEIRKFLYAQTKERRIGLLSALKLRPFEVPMLVPPIQLFLAVEFMDEDNIRAYLEMVVLIQEHIRLDPSDASRLLKGIHDACRPRSWLLCCMRSDSQAFKYVVKSDKELHALFKQAEAALKS